MQCYDCKLTSSFYCDWKLPILLLKQPLAPCFPKSTAPLNNLTQWGGYFAYKVMNKRMTLNFIGGSFDVKKQSLSFWWPMVLSTVWCVFANRISEDLRSPVRFTSIKQFDAGHVLNFLFDIIFFCKDSKCIKSFFCFIFLSAFRIYCCSYLCKSCFNFHRDQLYGIMFK